MPKKMAKKNVEVSYDIGLGKVAGRMWEDSSAKHLYIGVHGWLDNAGSFDALFGALSGPCLAIDLMGHGLSSHRPWGSIYHLTDYALDLKRLMNQLGQFSEFTLVGHSMGTSVVMEAALLEERVKRLILIDGLGPLTHKSYQWSENFKLAAKKHLEGPKPSPTFEDLDGAARYRQKSVVQSLDFKRARKLMERGIKPTQDKKWELSWDRHLLLPSLTRMTEDQVESLCRSIALPVLAFAGTEGLMTPDYMERKNWFPHIEFHRCPGDHYLHMEEGALPLVEIIEKVKS